MEVSGKVTSTSKTNFNLYCIPCDIDGLKEPAHGFCQDCQEHLCKICFQHHRRSRPSRNHVLLEKDAMPTQQTSVDDVNADVITDKCTNHRDEPLEFFCNNHKTVTCYICATLEHKQCKVDHIPEVSGNVFDELMEKLLDQLKSEKSFGTILTYRKPSADTELCVKYERSLNVKFPSDVKQSDVTGTVMISVTRMIVADCGNKKIKTINIVTGALLSEKTLSSGPTNLIKLPQSKLAVALTGEKCIQIMSYTDSSLSLDRRINVGESCYCVGYCQDKLVVGCNYNPGKLVVLDLDGKIIQMFDAPRLFDAPQTILISSNEKFMYVSYCNVKDIKDSKFIKIDWQGNVVQRFQDQGCKGPQGIQEMEDGMLFVCFYNSHKIVKLSSSFEACEIKGLEEINLYNPRTVTYSKRNHKFYVSCSSEQWRELNDTIKVFNVR